MAGPPNREGSPAPEGTAPGIHNPSPPEASAPSEAPSRSEIPSPPEAPSSPEAFSPSEASAPSEAPGPSGAPLPSDRRSMQVAVVAVLAGVVLAAIGAGLAWARVSAAVALPGMGSARVGAVEVTGNDLAPLGGLALLGLVLVVAVAATRGRGRWAVGLCLLAVGVALLVGAVGGAAGIRAEALDRAERGQLEGVPAGPGLRVATPRAGPALVLAGGLLLAGAGVEALRRGARWPALGAAFRAPPDRPPASGQDEPPWEGD
jgi:Tryptophan-associated transmembrane protein (Trp_oprn_chp)